MSDEYVPHQAPPAATPPTPSSSESVTPSKPSAASEFFRGIRTGLPVLSGCLPLGFILGVEAGRKGMTPLSIWMMTSINYAGGSEFAAVALWSAAPPMLVVWLTTWLINSRHIVMGASLSLYARHLPAKTRNSSLWSRDFEPRLLTVHSPRPTLQTCGDDHPAPRPRPPQYRTGPRQTAPARPCRPKIPKA